MNNKKYIDTVVTHGYTRLHSGEKPPSNPITGHIFFNNSTTALNNNMLIYNGTAWVSVDTGVDIEILIQYLGRYTAANLLKEEIIERELRKDDPALMEVWKEYKILAKLQADYDEDLDNIIKIK